MNILINIVQMVCHNRIGFLILILSLLSPLDAMDLRLISRHPWHQWILVPSTADFCRDGAEKEGQFFGGSCSLGAEVEDFSVHLFLFAISTVRL